MTDETHDPITSDGDWLLPHLAELPEPAMPAAVADRVLAAIRAEAAGRDQQAAAAAATGVPPSAPTDLAAARSSKRSARRWWAAAAGIAAAGLLGIVYVETMPTPSPGGSVAAEPPLESPNESAIGITESGARIVPVNSGSDYSVQNLPTMVPATLATVKEAAPTEVIRATFASTEAGIRSCLAGVGNPPQDLALLDLARFQNSPVAVLAYLEGNSDGTADIVVVGVRCSRDDPQVRHRDVANMPPSGSTESE